MSDVRKSSRRTLATAILLAVLLSACGSTSKQGDSLASRDGKTGRSASDTRARTGTSRAGERTSEGGTAASSSGTVRGANRSDAIGGPTGPVRGVTATEIRIGYGTQKDADQAAVGFGLNAVFGDVEAQARAIVDDINKHGGVLGRKLTLVVHDERSASDLQSPDTTGAKQCEDWTKDRPVFAGVNIVGARNVSSFFSCMAKAKTPLLVSDLVPHSLNQIATYSPYLYMPGVATLDRWAPTWINRLDARGYFTGWNTTAGAKGTAPVKVGVPYEDSVEGRRYLEIVKSALKSVGRRADKTFAFATNADDALRQIPQMVLQFKSENVTHVLLPANAYLVTPVAERQSYRPRYGMTTIDGLSSLTVTTSPPEQLRGTLGVGWLPVSDVDGQHDPGPVSPNQTRCKNVMEAAGHDTSDRLTFTTQLIICDLFLFLDAALEKAGAVTASALQKGAESLLERFASAMTFVERYGPRRYDGAAAVRDVRFDDGCSCFVYTDKVDHRLPA